MLMALDLGPRPIVDSMSASPKRKTSPVSSRAKTGKSRKKEPWGQKLEDFISVKISVTIPRFTEGMSKVEYFNDVSYKEYNTGEQITAAPIDIGKLSLQVEESIRTNLHHKLGPLIQKLRPLENLTMIVEKDECNKVHWHWRTDLETPHMDSPCKDICAAFTFNMTDTEGKNAMRNLLQEVITRLDRTATLSVVSTGSSKASRFACLVEMEYVHSPSPTTSSSEEYSQEYTNHSVPSEMGQSPITFRSSVQKNSPKPSGLGSTSSTNTPSPPRPKLRTSDVLVFSQESLYEPLVSNLVVSIKSGTVVNHRDIVQELLARLPYQTGMIYGLEISQLQANLYSVEKHVQDSGPIVRLGSYPEYCFREAFNDFHFPTFEKMVLDIGCILYNHDKHP